MSGTKFPEPGLIAAIEGRGWSWLSRSAKPGSPLDPDAQDKYCGRVCITSDGCAVRPFSAWGPTPQAALATAYAKALRSLN